MAKLGDGHASAMFRQGVRELRGALYPESNVAQQPEYGLVFTQTPGEVAEARRGQTLDLEQESPQQESVLADSMQRSADQSMEREQREPELER